MSDHATAPLPQAPSEQADFLGALRATWRAVLGDPGVWLLLLAAPLIYAFFYPWPYSEQAVTRVPVAVVDLDHSSLSRQIIRYAQASPRLDVQLVTGDAEAAQQALWRGEVQGIATLPADLKRDVVRGAAVVIPVEGNGAYALLNKAVLYGFSEAIGTVSAGIEIRRLQAGGQSAALAQQSRSPLGLQSVALFNPTEGYGSYVVPAVALLILQQTLLMGVALLAGTWAEAGRLRASVSAWAGRLLGVSGLGWMTGLFYLGWMWWLQDYPRGQNPWGGLLLLGLYVPCVCACGLLLGGLLRDRERALQVLLFTALPMAFLSGFSWPVEALPAPLQALRWLLPSTAGIQASLHLNQMGASWQDVAPALGALLGLGLAAAAALPGLGRHTRPPAPEAAPASRSK
ncbi:ABC transporter permease [Curvibacter sp. HBC28]|uniref:ABC transporter permease n=1 Tax=Curvibacter microcysteis TaxID=3026419 RepID=A0ABT5MD02_9BURK|nr:ABC transporter permease [Curvibacter sp. HBC28]MDD0814453.1 ABC transporter permease [Curvibacter sp. HBC28]